MVANVGYRFGLMTSDAVMFRRFYGVRFKGSSPNRFKLSKAINVKQRNDQKEIKRKGDNHNQTVFNFGEFGGLSSSNNSINPKITSKLIQNITNFDDLKLLPNVRDAIRHVIKQESLIAQNGNIERVVPSPIQTLAIKRISKNLMNPKLQVHAIAADTGSGKTMAYLAPLLDYLERERVETPESWDSVKDKAGILSIVLVPTHELVYQVYNTVKLMEPLFNIHTFKWDNTVSYPQLLEAIKSRIDIMVTTPAKLLSLFDIRMISKPERILSYLKFVVLDEADTLLDPSWVEMTHTTIRKFKNANHLIFCSATIPNEFKKTLMRIFPTCNVISTPRLHKLPKTLDVKLVDSALNPFKGSKIKALAQILYAIRQDGTEAGYEKRCIIFVNEKSQVAPLTRVLTEKYGHDCVGLSGDNTLQERMALLEEFIKPPKKLGSIVPIKEVNEKDEVIEIKIPDSNITLTKQKRIDPSKNNKILKVLVCTDLLARGLNFKGVRNVVLYDIPKTSIDLVHRVGRTGRMRQGGRVFVIIDKRTHAYAKALPNIVKKSLTLT